jgi:Flp pilus assembly pilin Flp
MLVGFEYASLRRNSLKVKVPMMVRLQLLLGRLVVAATDLRTARSRQEGQALIEYALIISLIAVVAIAALQLTGTNIKGLLNRIAGEV